LDDILASYHHDVLVIGAVVLQFYKAQGWIQIARRTGDVDLSIGVTATANDYLRIRQSIMGAGYSQDPEKDYRLIFDKSAAPCGPFSIDLLVHPKSGVSEHDARQLMGVGEEWDFSGVLYGLANSYRVDHRYLVPNPVGFLGLKRSSYVLDPRRVKDLVDIVDVIKGFVTTGEHYDLKPVFNDMRTGNPETTALVVHMLRELGREESTEWDLGRAEQEFLQRGYTTDDLETNIHNVVQEFNDALEICNATAKL
jgi:hypothetical protein